MPLDCGLHQSRVTNCAAAKRCARLFLAAVWNFTIKAGGVAKQSGISPSYELLHSGRLSMGPPFLVRPPRRLIWRFQPRMPGGGRTTNRYGSCLNAHSRRPVCLLYPA